MSAERPGASRVESSWRRHLDRLFGIDPRALAALRICTALLIVVDLALRAGDLSGLYTDEGVLPAWMISSHGWDALVPLHLLHGAVWYQALLFAIAGIFALLLLVGRFTRVASVASWALLLSLHARTQFFVDFGDTILRLVLFWCMFLPLGRRWSLDARRRSPAPAGPDQPVLSVAGAGLLFQIAAIYFFSALLKDGPDWRVNGTAIGIALQRDYWVGPFGVFLLTEFGGALKAGTFLILAFEFFGPILFFSPVATAPIRTLLVGCVWLLQIGLGLAIVPGIMPWTNCAIVLAFLPPAVWDALEARLPVRTLPSEGARAASGSTPGRGALRRGARIVVEAIAGASLIYVIAYNIQGVSNELVIPKSLTRVGHWLRINQKWAMFTPNAPRDDGWYVVPGRLRDGSLVDLSSRGPELSWEKPEWISARHRSWRWGIYELRLRDRVFDRPEHGHYRRRYAEWLCRRWNATHTGEQTLVSLELIFVDEWTRDDGSPPKQVARVLRSHTCGEDPYPTGPPL